MWLLRCGLREDGKLYWKGETNYPRFSSNLPLLGSVVVLPFHLSYLPLFKQGSGMEDIGLLSSDRINQSQLLLSLCACSYHTCTPTIT